MSVSPGVIVAAVSSLVTRPVLRVCVSQSVSAVVPGGCPSLGGEGGWGTSDGRSVATARARTDWSVVSVCELLPAAIAKFYA